MLLSRRTILLAFSLLPTLAPAEEALIGVATNFAHVAEQLEAEFATVSEHRVTLAKGSTGKLYAQVLHGAPFDALLAADQARPILLEDLGLSVAGSRFTYATGRLALTTVHAGLLGENIQESFARASFASLVIANPALAPYGAASREVLQSLRLWDDMQDRLALGENVGQAYALLVTGNAELGFVSLSLVHKQRTSRSMHYLEVPDDLHKPIRQDAVLLSHGENNPAAVAFLKYLKSTAGRTIISASGYAVSN